MSNYLQQAKIAIRDQAHALIRLSENIPPDFTPLVEYILQLKGRVILAGIGKSGHIARKIAASLASTGTLACFVHPTEASHGDLGMIAKGDLVMMLSNSGETRELFDVIAYCRKNDIPIAAITMGKNSSLAQNSRFLLLLPLCAETSDIGAPTTSALLALSMGDAIVTALHNARGFNKQEFLKFHPGGKIGSDLSQQSL